MDDDENYVPSEEHVDDELEEDGLDDDMEEDFYDETAYLAAGRVQQQGTDIGAWHDDPRLCMLCFCVNI